MRLGLALVAAVLASQAQAQTVIAHSAATGDYGWCSGGDAACAVDACGDDGATDCAVVATCGAGWIVIASPETPRPGLAIACGGETEAHARLMALGFCVEAANDLCLSNSTIAPDGEDLTRDANRIFDRTFYAQAVLQLSGVTDLVATGTRTPETTAAIEAFQGRAGLEVTGSVDPPLLFHLLAAVGGRQGVLDKIVAGVAQPYRDQGFAAAYLYTPDVAPRLAFGAELAAMSPVDAAAALATLVRQGGHPCDRDGVTASTPDPEGEIWMLSCTGTQYTVLLNASGTTILATAP
jgi:hypothetical protein